MSTQAPSNGERTGRHPGPHRTVQEEEKGHPWWQVVCLTWVDYSAYWRRNHMTWAYAVITLVFAATTVANMVERPDGLKIAGCFIAAVLIVSFGSRVIRSSELPAGPASC